MLSKLKEKSSLIGIFWMIVTTIFFVGVTIFVKILGEKIPSSQTAFLRYLFGTIFLLPIISSIYHKCELFLLLNCIVLFTGGSNIMSPSIYSDFLSNEGGNIVKNVDDVLFRLKSITKKNTGSVVFGVGNIVAESILPGALKSFCSKNKEVYPNFISGYWYELREKLLRQEINFFITANHLDAVDEEITQEDFINLKVNFYARVDHPLTTLDNINCVNLIEYPVITYHTVSSKKYIFDRLETQQQIDKLEKNFPDRKSTRLNSSH